MKAYKEIIAQVLVVIMFVVVMTAVGVAQKRDERKQENNEVCVEDNNVITINTTIMNAIDKSIDLNTIRIEQMFVIDTYIDDNTNVIVLEDTTGQVWECEGIDLGMEEEVLVLMSSNNTEDVTDDLIIHFWSSLE